MDLYEILEGHLLKRYSVTDRKGQAEKVNKILEHAHRVAKICEEFAVNLKMDAADQELLCTAAILHDIAKLDEKNGEHNILVEKVMLDMGIVRFADGKEDKVYDIIEAHKGKFSPSYDVALEAAILRIADKLDKFIKNPKKAETSCEDSYCEISKFFATWEIALPQMFIDTFEEIIARLKK